MPAYSRKETPRLAHRHDVHIRLQAQTSKNPRESGIFLVAQDRREPEKCLIRGDSWMFAPEAEYERHGDVQDVVFPCGYTVAPDGDSINLYYGAADSSIALAHGSIRSLLTWLDANGQSEQAHDRRQRQG